MAIAQYISPQGLNLNGISGAQPLALDPQLAQAAQSIAPVPQGTPQQGPPANPEEFAQRKAGWSQFLNGIQTDPNAQRLLLALGTGLLQPIQPGQTRGSHAANAIMGAVDYASAVGAANRAEARQERKLGLDEAQTGAQIESARTRTDLARQRIGLEERDQQRQEQLTAAQIADLDRNYALAVDKNNIARQMNAAQLGLSQQEIDQRSQQIANQVSQFQQQQEMENKKLGMQEAAAKADAQYKAMELQIRLLHEQNVASAVGPVVHNLMGDQSVVLDKQGRPISSITLPTGSGSESTAPIITDMRQQSAPVGQPTASGEQPAAGPELGGQAKTSTEQLDKAVDPIYNAWLHNNPTASPAQRDAARQAIIQYVTEQ